MVLKLAVGKFFMGNQEFENSNQSFKKTDEKMLTADEVQEHQMRMVRKCAAPAEGLSIKAQIRQAARSLKWDYDRTRRIWYGNAKVEVAEWEAMKWRVGQLQKRAAEREGLVNEIREKIQRAFPHHDVGDSG